MKLHQSAVYFILQFSKICIQQLFLRSVSSKNSFCSVVLGFFSFIGTTFSIFVSQKPALVILRIVFQYEFQEFAFMLIITSIIQVQPSKNTLLKKSSLKLDIFPACGQVQSSLLKENVGNNRHYQGVTPVNVLSCPLQTCDQLSRTYVTFKNNLEVYAGLSETSKIECFNVTSVYNVMNVTPVCKKT